MKILAICGSPRGNKSQTKALTETALEAARALGAETELFDLSRSRLEFCRACEACHQQPGCVLKDEGPRIMAQMLAADGLVLASPVYLNQVTAQLKALLDRSSHFVHCLRLTGKYLAVVTTSGGGGGADVQAYLKKYGNTVGAQCVGGVDARVPLQPADLAAASALGAGLAAAIRDRRPYPDQLQAIESQKRYFGALIAARKEQWGYEFRHWKDQGWLN